MPIDIDAAMLDYMRSSSGAIEVQLRDVDAERGVRALERARADIFTIPHPEQPESPYPSFASCVQVGPDGPTFWFDMADAEIYDDLLEGVLHTIVSSLYASGVDHALITWPGSAAQQRMNRSEVDGLRIRLARYLSEYIEDPHTADYSRQRAPQPLGGAPLPKGWSRRAPLPTPRSRVSAACGPDGRIYAIGGDRRERNVKTVEAYDPVEDQWSKVAPMHVARRGPGVALGADGRIYAIGGYGGLSAEGVTTVEAYDVETDRWEAVAPLADQALNEMAAARGLDGLIYAVAMSGGIGPNILESYDATCDRWTPLVPPQASYPTSIHAVAAPDGRIYTLGAKRGEVEAYDPSTATWASVTPRKHGVWWFGAALGGDGRLYAMGGSYFNPVATVEAYSIEEGRWTDAEPMPVPRSSMGLASDPRGAIYAIGGDGFGDFGPTDVYVP